MVEFCANCNFRGMNLTRVVFIFQVLDRRKDGLWKGCVRDDQVHEAASGGNWGGGAKGGGHPP